MSNILTVPDIVAHVRLGRSTVYRLLESGDMPGYKRAGRWLAYRSEIDEWVREGKPQRRHESDPMPKPPRRRRDSLLAEVVELRRTS